MDLLCITLTEMSDRERQIPYDFTYRWNLKNKTNKRNKTKQKQTHRYRELVVARGKGVGRWVK